MIELKETSKLMGSSDYKERFIAEYLQTKIRYEKLKRFNNTIEAARSTNYCCGDTCKIVKMPTHDCPDDLLREQQNIMGQYLHILEIRAEIEGIDIYNIWRETEN